MTQWRRVLVPATAVSAAFALGACGADDDADLVAGKKAFVQKCGACHVLERAGTKGNAGPNLDAAFVRAKEDGFNDKSIEGVVRQQIMYPSNDGRPEKAVAGIMGNGLMPADLVTGDTVDDVAAYVAYAAGEGGEDTGLLATAVPKAGGGKPIAAEGGKLTIPADPTGQLAYTSSQATAEAGDLEVESPNDSDVPHNIVIDGKGEGAVVEKGGNSTFRASFTPGEYTFYCSVPGHREGGMEGKLEVE